MDGETEDIPDAVDWDGRGGEEIRPSEMWPIKREVGAGVVGDEDRPLQQESWEPGVDREQGQVGEGEPLRDDVIGEEEGVNGQRVGCGVKAAGERWEGGVPGDEEGGGDGEHGGVRGGEDVRPVPEVTGPDQRVDDVVQLLEAGFVIGGLWLSCRSRQGRGSREGVGGCRGDEEGVAEEWT